MALPLSYRGMEMLPARQRGGHQEGSHFSLTWVGFPILFSLGDVSTDVANPFSDSSRIRTYDRLLRRQLLYPAELLSHERGGEQFVVLSYPCLASQLRYYRPSRSVRQPFFDAFFAGASSATSSVTSGSGSTTPTASRYSIAP